MSEKEPRPPRMPKGRSVRMHGTPPKAGHQRAETRQERQERLRRLREGKRGA